MKNSMQQTREMKVLISQIKAFCEIIHEVLGDAHTAEIGRYSCYKDMVVIYNDFAERAKNVLNVSTMFYTFNLDQIPSYGDSVWSTQKRILEQVLLSAKMLLSSLEESVDFIDDEFNNIENFLQSHIRTVIFQKPEREREVQNAIEALLLGRGLAKGLNYDRESGKFEFSGKEYIPDFIIPKMSLHGS